MKEQLPIEIYRDRVLTAVEKHEVVIIKAETGAGKSTQVPQFLLEYSDRIVVTQPRRLAAIGIATRVAQELQCEVGGIVGYHTSLERKSSNETRILFCTDGLKLVHEVLKYEAQEGILVIDEVHEWNLNIEVLIAWTRYKLQRRMPYKVVIMSATIDAMAIADYFGDATVIEIPGRSFPIEERLSSKKIAKDAELLLRQKHNVLVFLPGKKEIENVIAELSERKVEAELFSLHSDMTHEEQQPCFEIYGRPKCIVATNVAQTSITVPDIDAVVDSGLERRIEYVSGVEGLYIRPISLIDRTQRKGRAGRTKPGIYVDVSSHKGRQDIFPEADIVRLPIDKVLLQLARAGVDIEELVFFHQPSRDHIKDARDRLYCLGCLDRWGTLTKIGERVATLPISARWGRMIIEAEERQVLPDVITLVSIMNEGGITNHKSERWREYAEIPDWSDALVQLAAYEAACRLPQDELEICGIDRVAFARAREHRHRFYSLPPGVLNMHRSTGRQKDIVRSIYTGLADCLYKKSLVSGYKDKSGDTRNLPQGSVVADAEWIVGLPWNLQVKSQFGPKTLRLITMATRVDLSVLNEAAPHLVATKEKESSETAARGVKIVQTYFNGMLLREDPQRM